MRTVSIALIAAAVALTACAKQVVVDDGGGMAATVAPSLVVEQFLRAANAQDLGAMGRLFGTREGPISERDPRSTVEQRMFALASILRHDDFEVTGDQQVPGRTEEARKLTVRLKSGQRSYHVPFTMVRSTRSGWLVEQIGIDVITNPR